MALERHHFIVFFSIAHIIYGYQPQVGASADALVAFYDGDRAKLPIVFITDRGEIPMTVQAMKAGGRRVPDESLCP